MAATAAALSSYIQAREKARELIVVTNFETSGTATSINTTILEAYCTTAINAFEAQLTNYDPDNYAGHYDIAWYMTMALLMDRARRKEDAKEYRAKADALIPGLQKRRVLSPQSDSVWTPTAPTAAKPPFDDTFFTPFKAR